MPLSPFSPAAIAKSVHESLDEAYTALPPGATHALLVDATTDGNARALYVQRAPKGWQVALEGDWNGHGHVAGRVSVLKAWK